MIENEQQFATTCAQWQQFTLTLLTFQGELKEYPERWRHLHPLLLKAEQEATQSVIDELWADLETYAKTHRKETACGVCHQPRTCQLRPTGLLFAAWYWCCDACWGFAEEA